MSRRCAIMEPGKVGTYGRFNTLWYKDGKPMKYCSGKKYMDNGNSQYDHRCLQCPMCESNADYEFRKYVGANLVRAKKVHNIIEDIETKRSIYVNWNVIANNANSARVGREKYIQYLITEFVNKNCSLMEKFLYTNYYINGYTKKSIRGFFGIGEGAYNVVEGALLDKVGLYLLSIESSSL